MARQQRGDTADVVGVVVGGEYGAQFQPLLLQVVEHWPRIAWIDDCGVTVVPQRPDVIVFERAQRNDFEIIDIGHKPIFVEAQQKSNLADWFATPRGEYVLRWEQAQFDSAVEDVFGFNAVQVGLPQIDLLRQNRIPLRTRVGLDPAGDLVADSGALPLASG